MTELRRVKTWYGWTVERATEPEPLVLPPKGTKPEPAPKKRPVQPAIHGTRKRYQKGCRCAPCRRCESEWRAAWRLEKGHTKSSRVLAAKERTMEQCWISVMIKDPASDRGPVSAAITYEHEPQIGPGEAGPDVERLQELISVLLKTWHKGDRR